MSTNRKIINLVPKIINQSELFRKEVKKRIKLNNIFSEFEHKATNEFNYYIDDSNSRYNKSKCGYNIDNLISATKQKSVNHAKKILRDNFYFNNDISTEKSKMKIKNSSVIYNNLKKDINKIKFISNSEINITSQDNDSKINSKKKEEISSPISKNNRVLNIDKNKLDLKNFLIKEDKQIHDSIDKYQDSLYKLYEQCEKEKKIIETQNKEYKGSNEELEHELKFKKLKVKLPKIQLLNYKKYKPIKNPEYDKSLRTVDIFKLLPYTNKGKDYNNNTQKIKTKSLPYITECNNFEEKNNINNINNITNIEDTLQVVANSANKELKMENYFDKKKEAIEEVLRVDDIPEVNNYDKIVKIKSEKLKSQRNKSNIVLNNEQKYMFLSTKDRTNFEISDNISLLNKFEKELFPNE